jgi:outer membrane protein TolC
MKDKMARTTFKSRFIGVQKIIFVFAWFMAGVLLLGHEAAFAKSTPKQAAAVPTADQTVDRINKAIEEAEKKLGANPVVEEVRRDIRTNLVAGNTAFGSSAATTASQVRMGGGNVSKNAAPDQDFAVQTNNPPDLKFKTAEIRKQANSLAWKASGSYAQRENYEEAFDLSRQALEIDPKNRVAKDVQKRIERDIRERPMDIAGIDRTISPPDGKIALAVALSDGVVTLREAEEIAIKNNMMLESLRHRLLGARHKVNEAIRAFLPTLNLDISLGGGAVGNDSQPYGSERYMANFSQPVYYGGELIFTLKQAQASLRSDELKYQKERTDIILQLGEAYRNAVSAAHNIKYQSELYEQINGFKIREDKAFESRLIAEIDQLEVSSIFNQVSFQRESAVTAQKSANLTLCQAIGGPASRTIPIDMTVELNDLGSVDFEDYINRVGLGNYDIRIRQATLESAYYGARVYDAQRKMRIDVRGNVGMAGEKPFEHFDFNTGTRADLSSGDSVNWKRDGRSDLEKEYSIIAEVKVPFGPHTVGYTNQRRFFAPTVSSFEGGSNDNKQSVTLGVLDRLSHRTDEEIAKADYLKAMAELQKEKTDQEINARQAYYDYEGALLQLETSEAKIIFKERQVKILEQTTMMEEAKLTELLNELVSLAEDRYSRITAISSANNALAKMDYLAGTEGINNSYEVQSAQK